MKDTLNRLSRDLNLPVEVVQKAYKAYWRFIKTTIESLPLKEDLDESSFKKLRTNINLPNLGKLSCTYERYVYLKELNKRRNAKYQKD